MSIKVDLSCEAMVVGCAVAAITCHKHTGKHRTQSNAPGWCGNAARPYQTQSRRRRRSGILWLPTWSASALSTRIRSEQ